jgi:Na+-driven multidrug efflux pump
MLGATALAYYNVAGLGGNFVFGLLTQTGQAFTPHITREMGRGEEGRARLAAYLERPTLVLAYASALGLLYLSFGVPFLVTTILPHLEPGLPAFYWFVPGFFFLAIVETANGIANVILIERRQQRLQVYLQLATLALEAVLCAGLIRAGYGIVGAAFSSTASYAAYGLGTVALATFLVSGSVRRTLLLLGRILLPFVYGVVAAAVVYYVGRVMSAQASLELGVQFLVCSILALPLLTAVNRELPVGQLVAPVFRRLRGR